MKRFYPLSVDRLENRCVPAADPLVTPIAVAAIVPPEVSVAAPPVPIDTSIPLDVAPPPLVSIPDAPPDPIFVIDPPLIDPFAPSQPPAQPATPTAPVIPFDFLPLIPPIALPFWY